MGFKAHSNGLGRGTSFLRGLYEGASRGLSSGPLSRFAKKSGTLVQNEVRQTADRLSKKGTGTLSRSFEVTIKGRGKEFAVEVSSDLPYAKIQEFGGTITPKQGRFLTIPLNRQAKNRRARTIPNLHKRGKSLWLGDTPMYALARSVRIPAKGYLHKAMANSRAKLRILLGDAVRLIARNAKGR
jgi:hypothetical protein